MHSHIPTPTSPLPTSLLLNIANHAGLDEISNSPGSVRHHIYHQGYRHKKEGILRFPMLFAVYQTGRYGPQNGFRLVLVHRGYQVKGKVDGNGEVDREGEDEDEIDDLERRIEQGHVEMVVLGEEPARIEDPEEDEAEN